MSKIGTALVKELCIICCKEQDGPIVLNTTLTEHDAKKVEDMHGKILGFAEEPCEKCKEDLEKAFLFIAFDEDKSDMNNLPQGFHRTGQIIGVKKEIPLVQELVKEQIPGAIEKGYTFMPYSMMVHFNLIR